MKSSTYDSEAVGFESALLCADGEEAGGREWEVNGAAANDYS